MPGRERVVRRPRPAEHGELVAAEAGGQRRWREAAEAFRDLHEDLVAAVVPQLVVDLLEPAQVEHQHADGAGRRERAGRVPGPGELHPVGEPGRGRRARRARRARPRRWHAGSPACGRRSLRRSRNPTVTATVTGAVLPSPRRTRAVAWRGGREHDLEHEDGRGVEQEGRGEGKGEDRAEGRGGSARDQRGTDRRRCPRSRRPVMDRRHRVRQRAGAGGGPARPAAGPAETRPMVTRSAPGHSGRSCTAAPTAPAAAKRVVTTVFASTGS